MANLPPALPSLSYSQLVQNIIASYAAATNTQPQLSPGDPLLAFIQGVSSQLVYVEAVINQLAAVTRAQTSTGGDLDTWMAQFSFTRLPATFASGSFTLSVLSTHSTAVTVPVGIVIQTTGGAIQYKLIADTTQTAYNSAFNAYVLPANTYSINVTAQALVAGSASNVQIGQVNAFATQPAGIDLVTNNAAITNGIDAETDTAFRARFLLYLQGLQRATLPAIESAIVGVQSGLTYTVLDNTNNALQFQPGEFLVVINDGSGNPPSSLLAAVSAAVGAVAPLTVQWNVIGPTPVSGTVTLAVSLAAGYTLVMVQSYVQAAVSNYAQSVPLGGVVAISGIVQAALGVAGIVSVQAGVTINGGTVDLILSGLEVLVCPPASVTVTQYTN